MPARQNSAARLPRHVSIVTYGRVFSDEHPAEIGTYFPAGHKAGCGRPRLTREMADKPLRPVMPCARYSPCQAVRSDVRICAKGPTEPQGMVEGRDGRRR